VGVSWVTLKYGAVSTMVLMLFFAFDLIGLERARKKLKKFIIKSVESRQSSSTFIKDMVYIWNS
jgi:hypothetical protein